MLITQSDFTNSTEDDKRTGGDQPATNKQKAFVEVLANQSNKEISKEKLEDMSRNEASEKIDALKSEADKNQVRRCLPRIKLNSSNKILQKPKIPANCFRGGQNS